MSHSAKLLADMKSKLVAVLTTDLPNVENDMTFTDMVRAFAHLGPLREWTDWQREFKISHAMMDRWYRGVTRPHPLVRKQLIEHMLHILSERHILVE